MSRKDTLDWLANLQAELSSALRTPLDSGTGALRADVERYSSAVCAEVLGDSPPMAAERLAIYNRQYWFRLLRTLQSELPLTCRLWGAWRFNQVALRFLLDHPPRERDLGRVAEGFEPFLEHVLRDDLQPHAAPSERAATPRAALRQAARLDCAYRRVFRAPAEPRFDRARDLRADAWLHLSQAHARVVEDWPLLQLRARLLGEPCERPVALPEPLPRTQTWALVRTARGVGQVALEPEHARLLTLLETQPLSDALAQLEQECPVAERDALPPRVKRWLSRSVKLGLFTRPTQTG
jgi:Putative DNA-binding domain